MYWHREKLFGFGPDNAGWIPSLCGTFSSSAVLKKEARPWSHLVMLYM